VTQQADINIGGEIYTTDALKEMLGDWEGDDTSPPQKSDQPRASLAGQDTSFVSSELLINISDRYEENRSPQAEGRRTPVEDRLNAKITYIQGQLDAAISQVTALQQMVTYQRDFITQQQSWNTSISEETTQLSSRLVAADAKAEAAHNIAKQADSIARRSAEAANKSLQVAATHQTQIKALEASMAELNRKQESLSQQAGCQALTDAPADTFENSIFFGGVPAFRERMGLHPQSDPIFVVSRLLNDMGIYAGMNSIVLADNAAKTRLDTRAVIIHMQSSFHKRAAMAILRRELARQRLPGTAVRDCFPTSTMTTVKRYMRLGMRLKTAGSISKFQVINRRGQPILQTGVKNQNFADYQGDIDEEETDDNAQWTLVERRRKRQHPDGTLTSPNTRPLADRAVNNQPPPTAATWAALTEQEFPETSNQSTAAAARKPQPSTIRTTSQPVTSEKTSNSSVDKTCNQPETTSQQKMISNQQRPRREEEVPRGSQPGSYPGSRAVSRQGSRPATPPPIRSLFDDEHSESRFSNKPKPQRLNKPRAAQHQQHARNDH
jgi:hypothetical protein